MTLAVVGSVQLRDQEPIAQGSSRLVFEHPDDPSQLVKVLKLYWPVAASPADLLQSPGKLLKRRYKFARFMREVRQFVDARQRDDDPINLHLPEFNGLIRTDMGYGMAVQGLRAENGELAPTLKQLIKQDQFTPDLVDPLEAFLDHVQSSPVVVGDMNIKNLVLTGADGDQPTRFALIDGMGDSTLIPVLAMSRRLNERRKRYFAERIRNRYEQALRRLALPMLAFLPIPLSFVGGDCACYSVVWLQGMEASLYD